jgi:ketosteroid isomerase-like protein
MSIEANRQLAMRGYELFRDGDIPGILDQSTDDVEWVSSEIAQIPFSGTYVGKKEVTDFFTTLSGSSESLRFEPQEFIAERDRVVVIGVSQWRVRKTGVVYDDAWVHVFTMRDGKIARFRIYGNSAAAVAAFTASGSAAPEADPEAVAASMAH